MFQLTSSLPYLLNRLGVRMGMLFARRLEPYGLSVPMFRVLVSLADHPDQKLADLAATTMSEMSTMSRLIGLMVDQGWVTRERLPNDERTVCINLTKAGRDLATELKTKAKHYEDVIAGAIEEIEVDRFKSDVEHIYAALDTLEAELADEAAEVLATRAQRSTAPVETRRTNAGLRRRRAPVSA